MPTKHQRRLKGLADFTVHQPERMPSPVKSPRKRAQAVEPAHADAKQQQGLAQPPLTADPEDWERHLNAIKKQDLVRPGCGSRPLATARPWSSPLQDCTCVSHDLAST